MRKKILIPTDFSRNAWDAIAYAVDLYRARDCDFFILNTYDYTSSAMDSIIVPKPDSEYAEKIKGESIEGLNRILKQLEFRDEGRDHKFITISRQDQLIGALRDIVELEDIDLIVMGTKGETDALNVAFGSNTVMAMEKVRNCPVLAVPGGILYEPGKEIVFATSYKTHFKKRELVHLVEIAKLSEAPIRVLHIEKEKALDETQEHYQSLLAEILQDVEYSFHTLENHDIAEAINLFVESRSSGMVSFINKKHSFFGSIFSRPLVKDLGVHSQVPVLALHDLRN